MLDLRSRAAAINALLTPASIALVGVSPDPNKLRGKMLGLLTAGGFAGRLYPVTRNHGIVQGLRAYPDLTSLPETPDLVVLCVPGLHVPSIIKEASDLGVMAAVIISADVDGAAILQAAGTSGMIILGPNTEGFYRLRNNVAATFAQTAEIAISSGTIRPRTGKPVSIVSQSGGIGFALFGRAVHENLNIHSVITTGNEADLDCLECVDYLIDEGETGVICMFIEGLKQPLRLTGIAEKAAANGIPIIVMKVGRSEAGQRAAVSHTAHLTGADTAYDAYFARYGVMRVSDIEEMLALAAAFSRLPLTAGRRAAVVTTSGGAGGWAADLCGAQDIALPALSEALQRDIANLIPAFGATGNPVDVTGQAVEDGGVALVKVLELLSESSEIDAIIVNIGLAKTGRIRSLGPILGPVMARMSKPILFNSHILAIDENLSALADLGGHGFPSFRACSLALDGLDRYARFRARQPIETQDARTPLLPPDTVGILSEADTSRLLSAYGIPTPPGRLVQDCASAHHAAADIGYPVVLKIQSPDIPHKTEAGGVALNVEKDTLPAVYESLLASALAHAPRARIEGVLVQRMSPPGIELVVGAIRDPDFGPLVMIGAGGIYLEILRDVIFSPPPIDQIQAKYLIDQLKIAPILKGTRGRPPADISALAGLITAVAQLVGTEASIDQIDLNPVFVYPEGRGVVAVDSLISAGSENRADFNHETQKAR